MELEKVIFQKTVLDFFEELVFVLFEKDYFTFEENAVEYVANIVNFSKHIIPKNIHKTSPSTLRKYGSHYIIYQANNNTSWYIFFEKNSNRYIVTAIFNNHQPEIQFLNS